VKGPSSETLHRSRLPRCQNNRRELRHSTKLFPSANALSDRTIVATADAAGLYPATSTPAEFAAFISREAERWSKVLPGTGMRFD
jgi:hypothetical protein